jgi:5-methylthioribose kinase
MFELTAQTVPAYLIRRGWVTSDEPIDVRVLSGGVSNVVLLIRHPSRDPYVLKQSRAQLRTQADWFSQPERIFREEAAQRILSQLLPPGAIPNVLFEDRENYCYAMTAVRPDHLVWKRQLLSGHVDPDVFAGAGALLGEIHATTAGNRDLLAEFRDTIVFFELRVDPFYRRIAKVHPSIRFPVERLIADMSDHAACLVHADFSPKNLLVHPDGLTLVDHETVHFGDPAFDLGFFFSHLWLKMVALPTARAPMMAGIQSAWQAYCDRLDASQATTGISLDELSHRAVPHLAACLLSRVDGKSPVDYLTSESQRSFVRDLTLGWFMRPPQDMNSAFRQLSEVITSVPPAVN